MRNFEQRKQEILRRAQVRIARRKKIRNQLLGVGIPVVCLALAMGIFLDWGENTGATNAEIAMDQLYAESAAADAPAADAPLADAPAADVPAADAPAAEGAPLEDHTHKDADYCDCTGADAPAEPQPFELPDWLRWVPGETFTEYEGVYIQIDEENLAFGVPVFLCWNQSGEFVHLEDRDLVRWEDGQWVSSAMESEPMELPPWPDEITAAFGAGYKEYDYTQPGVYRYICTFRVGEDETVYTMWAEFTLTEGG